MNVMLHAHKVQVVCVIGCMPAITGYYDGEVCSRRHGSQHLRLRSPGAWGRPWTIDHVRPHLVVPRSIAITVILASFGDQCQSLARMQDTALQPITLDHFAEKFEQQPPGNPTALRIMDRVGSHFIVSLSASLSEFRHSGGVGSPNLTCIAIRSVLSIAVAPPVQIY